MKQLSMPIELRSVFSASTKSGRLVWDKMSEVQKAPLGRDLFFHALSTLQGPRYS